MAVEISALIALQKHIQQVNHVSLEVGFWSGGEPDSYAGKTLPEVALSNEYGDVEKGVPSRPFFYPTLVMHEQEYAQKMAYNYVQIEEGKTSDLSVLGEQLSNDIKQAIIDKKIPQNAPATIESKGFNDPLIDSGYMRDHVQYKEHK